jgi:hypothetical protein
MNPARRGNDEATLVASPDGHPERLFFIRTVGDRLSKAKYVATADNLRLVPNKNSPFQEEIWTRIKPFRALLG